jgi:O-antigen/teichoic acid export membrane protein
MVRWIKQTFVPAAVLIGGAALASAWVIPLIDGGRYPLSVPIFQVLLALTFVQYILLPSPGLLIAQKRYSTLAWVNLLAVILNVAAAVIAAPLLGVVGVAVAGTVVGIAQTIAVVYLALQIREEADPDVSVDTAEQIGLAVHDER